MSPSTGEFHLFSTLPYELRLKIYNLILKQPRTVSINCEKRVFQPARSRYISSYSTDTPIPPLLHVTRETRREALKYYTPLFTTTYSPNYIYINWALDTIDMADGTLGYLEEPEHDGIQRLILHVQDSIDFGHFHMGHLVPMNGLKELELVGGKGELYSFNREGRYIFNFLRDLRDLRKENSAWICPRVRIIDGHSRMMVGFVNGGGWDEELVEEEFTASVQRLGDVSDPRADIMLSVFT